MWHAYHSGWHKMSEFLMTIADHNNNGNYSSIGCGKLFPTLTS